MDHTVNENGKDIAIKNAHSGCCRISSAKPADGRHSSLLKSFDQNNFYTRVTLGSGHFVEKKEEPTLDAVY